jgi:tetraacyldisaccharide 4'-kinase
MKFNKPKFWDKKFSFIGILLSPLSLFVFLITFIKKKIIKTVDFNIPIICVGNIYIGGTGKTPSCIYIAKELSKLGKKPSIVRKYYKSHKDEHDLIYENFNNLILSRDRGLGIKEAKKRTYDSVILDDGFQDYRLKKNLNIICFNQNQLVGNGLILPSGPLRESLSALKNANIILINGKQEIEFEKKILNINNKLEIFYSEYIPINIDHFKNKKLLALTGIGNPNNFFNLLKNNDLNVEKELIYPDHYEFSKSEILNIVNGAKKMGQDIIMTEKDYFKIKDFNLSNIKYLKVKLKIAEKEKLLKLIMKIYD